MPMVTTSPPLGEHTAVPIHHVVTRSVPKRPAAHGVLVPAGRGHGSRARPLGQRRARRRGVPPAERRHDDGVRRRALRDRVAL